MVERTRNDLILRTLTMLGAAGTGQPPSNEDRALVEAHIDTMLDQLTAKRICDFPTRNTFDGDIFTPLSLRLACAAGPDIAISKIVGYETYTLDQVARLAESEIRFIRGEDQTDEPVRFNDF